MKGMETLRALLDPDEPKPEEKLGKEDLTDGMSVTEGEKGGLDLEEETKGEEATKWLQDHGEETLDDPTEDKEKEAA